MPVWDFKDFADIIDNANTIRPKYNKKVHISVGKKFLYINGMALPTGPAGDTAMTLMANYTGCYWGYGTNIGATGLPGPTGAYGGPPGETGVQGETGMGPQGVTGLIGVTGAYGGPQGETGLQGSQGETGVQGDVGVQGETGSTGETGPQSIILYGTGSPPSAVGKLDGTIYVKYVV